MEEPDPTELIWVGWCSACPEPCRVSLVRGIRGSTCPRSRKVLTWAQYAPVGAAPHEECSGPRAIAALSELERRVRRLEDDAGPEDAAAAGPGCLTDETDER